MDKRKRARRPDVGTRPGEVGADTARAVASELLIDRGVLVKDATGRYFVNGTRLGKLRRDLRMRVLLQVVEAQALMGSLDAAKAALAHHRWVAEMKDGRAPIRGELVLRPASVVDDLGTRRDLDGTLDVGVSQDEGDGKPRLVAKG